MCGRKTASGSVGTHLRRMKRFVLLLLLLLLLFPPPPLLFVRARVLT